MKTNVTLAVLGMALFLSCKKPSVEIISAETDHSQKTQLNGAGTLALKGVKLKNEMDSQDNASSPRFETEGLSYAEAAAGLQANGVNVIVLKVAEESIMPDYNNDGNPDYLEHDIHTEVLNMVRALKNNAPDVKVYLWQRQWLQKDHSLNGKDEDFAAEMKRLIDRAVSMGIDDKIAGIGIIENNLESTSQVLSQALSVVRKINNKTGGWMHSKTFLFPGAAMGGYFKGIHAAAGHATFFSDMAAEVDKFSFIYKHMKSQDQSNCSLGSFNTAWTDTVGPNATTTVAQQQDFLNTTMGLNNLNQFINSYTGTDAARVCNVTFWGDSGDGMIKMSRNSILAVNGILVQNRGWKSYFIDMAYTADNATGNDLTKYILKVSPSKVITKNFATNSTGFTTVWDEWNKWQWAVTGY